MELKLIGLHIELTPALREHVNAKFQRIARHVESVITVTVTLSTDKLIHKAYADIHVAGKSIHSEATNENMYTAIDILIDKLDRAILKHKEKTTDHILHHH